MVEVTGDCPVLRLTSSFVTWAIYGIRNIRRKKKKFRDHIPDFAEIAQPLTDLTGKRVLNRVPWGEKENLAFEKLKEELCKATTQSTSIADFSKPYLIEVDISASTVGAALLQSVEGQGKRPVAFASQKLTTTQKAWSTIEKEAYAAICALQKFRNWIFGQPPQ